MPECVLYCLPSTLFLPPSEKLCGRTGGSAQQSSRQNRIPVSIRAPTNRFFFGVVNSQLLFRAESTPELILFTTLFGDSFYYDAIKNGVLSRF